jgi:lipopolysaccharide export system permease protein
MILYRHVIREHIFPFLFSLAILVFISIMQYAIQILDNIISRGLDAAIVLEVFAINLGWIIALAIPMAILTSTLMAFGRMSADNEILCVKASGLGMNHLITPVMIASVICCVCLVYFNDLVLPDANHRTANLMSDISRKRPAAMIEPGVLIRDFENYAIYVTHTEGRTGKLRGVKIFSDVPGENPSITMADSGEVKQTSDGAYLRLALQNGETHSVDVKDPKQYFISRFEKQVLFIRNPDSELRRTNSTYRGDREQNIKMMQEQVDRFRKSRENYLAELNTTLDSTAATIIRFDALASARGDSAADSVSIDSIATFAQWVRNLGIAQPAVAIQRNKSQADRIASRVRTENMSISQYLVEIHKKFSIPVTCIVFVLIGAPLGIMARSGGLGVGASYSIFFFILFWAFLIQGEHLADRLIISPFWAMWSANIIIGISGIYLLIRMMRETTFISFTPATKLVLAFNTRFGRSLPMRIARAMFGLPGFIIGLPFWVVRKMIGILPFYVIRIFVALTFGLLTAIIVIFVVIDYVSNSTRFADVAPDQILRFYLYYLPWIIQMLLPIVLLLASMFTMGRLAKHSELIAMKAAGKSIRRITLPLLGLGLGIVALTFYFSEKVLPYANVKRMRLTEEIKDSKNPDRSNSYRVLRDFRRNFYYFGNASTIYQFEEFRTRPQKTRNVWRLTFKDNRIVQRIQAERSTFDNGAWYFHNGTVRAFIGDSSSETTFDTLRDSVLQSTPEEMVVYIKSPEEMSYWELNDFIEKSKRRGEEVQKYATDLDFKIAYPFMNFIVILLGIAITARMGRKGGAVLLGTGLLLVFSYWILVRFAIAFGKSGQLSPLVGAWLGNILFLVLGAYLYKEADQ